MTRFAGGRRRSGAWWPAGADGTPRLIDPPLAFSWPVALGIAALCVLLNDPGRLNADSLFEVVAATTPGLANNWHSATLGWLWSLPGGILGQPRGALLMQAALLGACAGFLPRTPPTPRGRATLALELLLRLVLVGTFGFVGKDAVTLATLLLGVQLARRAVHGGWSRARLLALAASTLLFLLVRAPDFVVLVTAFALLLPFRVRSPRRHAAAVVAVLAIGVLAIPLGRTVDRIAFAARDVHPDKQLVIFDLAGISVRTGEDAFARVPGWPRTGLPSVRSCYLPYMWDSFAPWAPCRAYSAAYDRADGPLKRVWAAAIMRHPLAYARHRLTYTAYLLASRDQAGWGAAGNPINAADDPAARAEQARLLQGFRSDGSVRPWRPTAALAPFAWLQAAFFAFPGAGWAGFLVAVAVLGFGWTRRAGGVRLGAVLPAALAIGNVAMLAVFGVADPARYLLPTICLAWAAVLALLAPGE